MPPVEKDSRVIFAVIRHDKPDSVALRQSTRPKHLEYLDRVIACITGGGALLNDQGQQIGSILFIDVPDRAAAEHFAGTDPFEAAGLFASTHIQPFNAVFKDGARI
jgi:uncharacterized protein YciI